ncbi:MAG: gfo/Idh/MocA family oxidoreductase [Ignavibacteriae bacterium HGW-Ignavibacteriae-3]|nr:MAG: gfo/Idh/MocA family oxidoreductase [Ignavibacteriae bacterium HGW-Ignavibacteriae-3]
MINPTGRLKFSQAVGRKLKWGIAGCGSFAETSFLPALQLARRSKLVSVYSHDLKRAQHIAGKFGAPNSFNDYDKFLQSDIDAVYISSINSDHYLQILRAAEAGKNILCERPMTIDSVQAEEIVRVCKEKKVLLVIDHLHRFHPLVQKAKELIDKHMLGKIVSVSASYNIDYPPNQNFRFKKELSGGGVLRDLGSQMIDMLTYFGGEIVEIKAFMDNVVYKSDVEDFASAIMKFRKSGYGYFNISYNTKKAYNRIEILGYNGSITIENFFGKRIVATKLIIDLQGEAKKVFRKRTNKLLFLIRSVQKTFLKNEPPLVTGEDALLNIRVIEEIERQCHYGKN